MLLEQPPLASPLADTRHETTKSKIDHPGSSEIRLREQGMRLKRSASTTKRMTPLAINCKALAGHRNLRVGSELTQCQWQRSSSRDSRKDVTGVSTCLVQLDALAIMVALLHWPRSVLAPWRA